MTELQGKSEVANLLAQIDAEYTAAQRVFSGFTATARHDFISKRMERIDVLREQIGNLLGDDEANRVVCERWLHLEDGEAQKKNVTLLPPLPDLIEQVTQEASTIVGRLNWHTSIQQESVPEEIPSVVYAHLLRILAKYPQEVAPVLLSKLTLFYLRYQLNPRLSFPLTLGLFARDLVHVASYGKEKQVRAITQNALLEKSQLVLHLSDLSQAAFPLRLSEQIEGYLALSTPIPKFFTPERLQVIMLYTYLFSLAFRSGSWQG